MTARDDALLAPAAVRVVETRAQQVWRVGIGAVVLQAARERTRQATSGRRSTVTRWSAWAQHRRHRLRLEAFLDGLDPLCPAADRQ